MRIARSCWLSGKLIAKYFSASPISRTGTGVGEGVGVTVVVSITVSGVGTGFHSPVTRAPKEPAAAINNNIEAVRPMARQDMFSRKDL